MDKSTVQWFQVTINLLAGTSLALDGVIGPATLSAWGQLDPASRYIASQGALALGLPAALVVVDPSPTRAAASALASNWVTRADLEDHMATAERLFGVPIDHVDRLIRIESNQTIKDGTRYFDTNSRMGSFHGLTQMGKPAWTDATEWALSKGVTLPPFEQGRYDPKWSILAMAAYSQRYTTHHSDVIGVYPSFAMRYSLHNQGPSFVKRALQGFAPINYVGQSAVARSLLDLAKSELA